MTIIKYIPAREWQEAGVFAIEFEQDGDRLVAPLGHRKRTRGLLGGAYITHKDDRRLFNTRVEALTALIDTLKQTIAPTLERIAKLEAMKLQAEFYNPALGESYAIQYTG